MVVKSNEPAFYLLKRRLPASETAHLLGRVVLRYQDPTFDYTPESPSNSLTVDLFNQFILGVQYEDIAHFKAKNSQNDKFWGRLKGLLSISSTDGAGGSSDLVSLRITTRRLKLEKQYFNMFKALPKSRQKMLEMCPISGKVYLVVGIMSAHTLEVKRTGIQQKDLGASLTVPLRAAVALSGLPADPNAIPNPEARARRTTSSAWDMEFTTTAVGQDGAPDGMAEEVFAIALKEITRDWQGFGRDLKMKTKQPEYRGGQNYGDNDSDSGEQNEEDEGDEDEEAEILAAQGLELTGNATEFLDGEFFTYNSSLNEQALNQ
ncbi:hypothetical protein ABW20_dc0106395 [Dactylellina cionopaga]|nr:hypothetical protein ABW20_dc0106395 [Dactylellina cionopaga]